MCLAKKNIFVWFTHVQNNNKNNTLRNICIKLWFTYVQNRTKQHNDKCKCDKKYRYRHSTLWITQKQIYILDLLPFVCLHLTSTAVMSKFMAHAAFVCFW